MTAEFHPRFRPSLVIELCRNCGSPTDFPQYPLVTRNPLTGVISETFLCPDCYFDAIWDDAKIALPYVHTSL
jgi:hypothetical protein